MTKKHTIVSLLVTGALIAGIAWLRSVGIVSAQQPAPRVQTIDPSDAWELAPAIEDGITTRTIRSYRFLADEEKTTFTLQVISQSFRRVRFGDDGTTVFVRRLKENLEMNPQTGEITERGEAR